MKVPTPVELLIESERTVPEIPQGTSTDSYPWLKFIIVAGIVVLAFKVAYDYNRANQLAPIKPLNNEDN